MKKVLLIISIFFSLISTSLMAQDVRYYVETKMDNSRFEVIQSPILRKNTFILDKVEGNVFQLVSTSKGGLSWEIMEIYPKDNEKYSTPTYQIFLGGIMARDAFLINTKTGRSWVLVKDKNGVLSWEEMN